MSWLHAIIPNPQDVLALEPEELAAVILAQWNANPEGVKLNRHNFGLRYNVEGYPSEQQPQLLYALMEVWACLEAACLIAPQPSGAGSADWYFITRRGKLLRTRNEAEAYLRSRTLPG